MWRNWNSHKLLVGIQNARVNLVILCQFLINLICNYPTPSYLPWRNKNHVNTKSCMQILTGTLLISTKKLGENPYLFQLVNKQCVEYPYSGILLSNKNSKLWTHMTCMNQKIHLGKLKRSNPKSYIVHNSIYLMLWRRQT